MFDFLKQNVSFPSADEARKTSQKHNNMVAEERVLSSISKQIKEAASEGKRHLVIKSFYIANNKEVRNFLENMGYEVQIKNDSPYCAIQDNYLYVKW